MNLVNSYTGCNFNGILINEYPDGGSSIAPHSDDEKFLDPLGVVGISFGASRLFRIREKGSKKVALDLPLDNSSMYMMGPGFQLLYTHEVPARAAVREKRISLTFRKHTK